MTVIVSELDLKLNAQSVNNVDFFLYYSIYFTKGIHRNKDHQRMMVDPMLMIVQSLRSFLTAVATTAVAPIVVILPVFT